MLAWGPSKGYIAGHLPMREAARRFRALGYEWAALILDDGTKLDNDDPESITVGQYNRDHWGEYVSGFHAEGMLAGAWVTEGGNLPMTPADADLSIAELEGPWGGPGDYEGIMRVISLGQLPRCPLAICTNFSSPSVATARPLIQAGFACLTEAYMNENLNATPDALDRTARSLGWPTSQPVFGVYPTAGQPNPVPLYQPWQGWPGVDYLGEYIL